MNMNAVEMRTRGLFPPRRVRCHAGGTSLRVRFAVLLFFSVAISAAASVNPRLTLPPAIYAVPGGEMNVFFENTVLLSPGQKTNVQFRCECPVGVATERRWTLNARDSQVGEHPFRLVVLDRTGKEIESAKSRVIVSAADAGEGRAIRLLMIGDSLTHATLYPNEVARLLSRPGNPAWRMLGTHRPRSAAKGVAHEGYGGWTWNRFRTKFSPERPYPGKTNSSPFVFAGTDGKPQLDVARYFRDYCEGERPDFITIMLGINDCFGAKPDTPDTIDSRVDLMFREAEPLLKALRVAAPRAQIGICLTTPGNRRDGAFTANYKGRYPRWGWRRIQHRLVERLIEHFRNREAEGLHLIPTQLNLDTTDGYPENNGVHPNAVGYAQIGATIHAWLKSRDFGERR